MISRPILAKIFRISTLIRSNLSEKHDGAMDDMIEGTSLVRTEDDLSETNFDHSDIVDNYSEVLITFFLKNQ